MSLFFHTWVSYFSFALSNWKTLVGLYICWYLFQAM